MEVELVSFTVRAEEKAVSLDWATASETNSYRWVVDRSTSAGNGYAEIGSLPAAGDHNGTSQYRYVDGTVQTGNEYWYRLGEIGKSGNRSYFSPITISIATPSSNGPTRAYPNPFRQSTMINYQLTEPGRITLKVCNVNGQLVRTLADGQQDADYPHVSWNGEDDAGQQVSAGVYLYRLEVNGFSATKKATIIK